MDFQQVAALGIVAAAAAALGRNLWRQSRGDKGTCGGCGECGRPSRAPKATPLITLDAGARSRPSRPGKK